MSCNIAVAVSAASTVLEVVDSASVVLAQGPPIVLQLQQSNVTIEAPATTALVIEVCKQGPTGPPGAGLDPVFLVKPNSTLTYNVSDQLVRIDYADGTYKILTYDGNGFLTQIVGVDLLSQTITKTLGYTGSQLSTVTTSIT